jgi:hypothetical protein
VGRVLVPSPTTSPPLPPPSSPPQVRFFGEREARLVVRARLDGPALLRADAASLAALGMRGYLRTLVLREADRLRPGSAGGEERGGAGWEGGGEGGWGEAGWGGGPVWAAEEAEREAEWAALQDIAQVISPATASAPARAGRSRALACPPATAS